DAPRDRRLVELGHNVCVDGATGLERPIKLNLADLAAECRLGELGDSEVVIGDAVRGEMRIQDLHVEDCVDTDLDVVPRYADLFGNVKRLFLWTVPIGDALDEWNQNVESGLQRAAVLAKAFDDVRALL